MDQPIYKLTRYEQIKKGDILQFIKQDKVVMLYASKVLKVTKNGLMYQNSKLQRERIEGVDKLPNMLLFRSGRSKLETFAGENILKDLELEGD